MSGKVYILLSFFLLATSTLIAQDSVRGRVNNYTFDSLSPLPGASVLNAMSGQSVNTDQYGNYTIKARLKDRIVFSHVNFTSDSIIVEAQLFISGYDAALIEKTLLLNTVVVEASYKRDSIRRMGAYSKIFEKQPGITGGNTPAYGAGVTISPFSYYSKQAKQERRLKQRLIKHEEEEYVDYVFSKERVRQLTGLEENSLQKFLLIYRPTYKLSRQLGYDGMSFYINDKFKEFSASKAGKNLERK